MKLISKDSISKEIYWTSLLFDSIRVGLQYDIEPLGGIRFDADGVTWGSGIFEDLKEELHDEVDCKKTSHR